MNWTLGMPPVRPAQLPAIAAATALILTILAAAAQATTRAADTAASAKKAGTKPADIFAAGPKAGNPRTGQPSKSAPQSGPRAEDVAAGPVFTIKRTDREIAYFKAFDDAISEARGIDISSEQASLLKSAVGAIETGDLGKFADLIAQIRDPAAKKLADWYRLRAGWGKTSEYGPFLEANPAWPDRNILIQRWEELTFSEGGPANAIKDQFEKSKPRNAMGHAALASAELFLGDTEAARKRAVKAWRDMRVPAVFETPFLERFGAMISEADHSWRLDRLLIADIRSAKDRAERIPAIRRQIERLKDADARKRAEARLLVFNKAPVDDAKSEMLKALSAAPKSDYGFLYHRIQLLRRQEKQDDAIKLLQKVPVDPDLVAELDEWWDERRALGYYALNKGNAKLAYSLVKDAGPLSVNPAKEQAFMAGWLALRFLDDRKAARGHFEQAAKVADGPLSRSRASYWLGRLAERDGGTPAAKEHYARAAKEIDTFYGQLARLKIEPSNRRIEIRKPPAPSAAEIARFNNLDAVRAAVIARKANLDLPIQRSFFAHLRAYFESNTEIAMVNHLAVALGDVQQAVRNGKSGIARGQDMLVYSYPLHTFPAFKPLGKIPEPAFILAITRQETEFNKNTVSVAGAKGLMQVMTVTAQHVCKDYKFRCELDRLLSDAAYNATIAASYIGDRLEDFRGSYVLAMSGFNAGPGRTRQWIGQFGDPRDPNMDPVDWIERIPFQETREYVSKVLSNVQIYRARLGNEANALQLDVDLNRGRGTSKPAAEPASPVATAGSGSASQP